MPGRVQMEGTVRKRGSLQLLHGPPINNGAVQDDAVNNQCWALQLRRMSDRN